MAYKYGDLVNGMRRSNAWIDQELDRIILSTDDCIEYFWFDNNRGFHRVKYIDTDQMIKLPMIHPGYIESTYLHKNKDRLQEIIQRYDLENYMNTLYPLFVPKEMDEPLFETGRDLWSTFLCACEENEWLEDEYDQYESEYEERIVQNWCQQHGIEYQR